MDDFEHYSSNDRLYEKRKRVIYLKKANHVRLKKLNLLFDYT